ncbi:MAG: hypothetical protein DHS20C20_07840 [Ardenticatenaceae bacterium]|nr:MAG: hypothetical protein DHS20C20_07840 [Ardenticatenaceae bacterium]
MSEQITITVSSKVYRRILEQAKQSRTNVSDLLNGVVANAFVSDASGETPAQEKMLREVEAYKNMHAQLASQYAGQFVAIHNGQLVDYDVDKDALFFRVKQNFPNKIVLQRQVLGNPDPVLHFRSPRIQQS